MIAKLYNKLNSPTFLAPSGIAYNFYIVPYDVRQEAKLFSDLAALVEQLKRPADYIEVLSIDLFAAFLEFLAETKFGPSSLIDHLLQTDANTTDELTHAEVTRILSEKAHSSEFLAFVHAKVTAHFANPDSTKKRPYVFLCGIGAMFPYLRANEFLTKYESVNDAGRYKVILFYPGTVHNAELSLYGVLNDKHAYRAQILEL